jgi:hypothetical protein
MPIAFVDIVDEQGRQIYYALSNYWEKYSYDGDGTLIAYSDSTLSTTMTQHIVDYPDMITTNNHYEKASELFNELKEITRKYNKNIFIYTNFFRYFALYY